MGFLGTFILLFQHQRWGYSQYCPIFFFLHCSLSCIQLLKITKFLFIGHNDSPFSPSSALLLSGPEKAVSSLPISKLALSRSSLSDFVQGWLQRWMCPLKLPYKESFSNASGSFCQRINFGDAFRGLLKLGVFSPDFLHSFPVTEDSMLLTYICTYSRGTDKEQN